MLRRNTNCDKIGKIEEKIHRRFVVWTTVSQVWTFLAAAYIVIVPLFEEVSISHFLFRFLNLIFTNAVR